MMIDLPIRRGYEGPNRVSTCQFLRMRPLWLNYDGSEKLTDFQVKCVLTPSDIPFEKLRADKQDLLFVDNNNEPIPYWIEKADSTEIIVWLKFSEIIPGKEVFWLYYGNGNFSGASNVVATFIRVIDGVVGAWHFDEGSGTTAKDTSGNNNDGTIYGATWTDGKFGKALSFDGSDDYVDVPHSESLSLTETITAEAWIKASAGVQGYILVKKDYNHYGMYIGDDYDRFDVILNDNNFRVTFNYWDVWKHVAFTYDKAAGKVIQYIDGEQVKVSDFSETIATTTENLQIGRRIAGHYFEGVIDEVRLYNRALSAEEISDLYNNYGYTTTNYPGKVLVRKYTEPEPSVSM